MESRVKETVFGVLTDGPPGPSDGKDTPAIRSRMIPPFSGFEPVPVTRQRLKFSHKRGIAVNAGEEVYQPRPHGTTGVRRRERFCGGVHPSIQRFHPLSQILEHRHPIAFEGLEDPWDRNPVCSVGRYNAGRGAE